MKPSAFLCLLILLFTACVPARAQIPTPSPTSGILSTVTPRPPSLEMDPTVAFITMVMSTKYAAQTAFAAIPTQTATPTIQPQSRVCRPADLKASYNTNGAAGRIAIGIVVLNQSSTACFVPMYPAAKLFDRAGKPLDISYDYLIQNSNPTTAQPTDETLPGEPARYGLKAGQQAVALLLWGNWCKGAIQDGVIVRLPLLNQMDFMVIPTDLQGGGFCDEQGSISTLDIMQFETFPNP